MDGSASFVVDDPTQDDWGQDIVVHNPNAARPAPKPTPPIGLDSAGPSSNGASTPAPVYFSNEDVFGTSTGKPAPANSNAQGAAPSPRSPTATSGSGGTMATPPAQSQSNPAPQYFSNDEVFGSSTSAPPLANTGDEGYLSGLLKGGATAAIKGLADIPGFAGNLGNLADYLLARGESAVTGRDVGSILQRYAQDRAQALPLPEPPSGEDIAAPILAKTGDYVPDTSWGRAAQAGAEGAISMLGPGGGAIAKGATAPDVIATIARQAAPVAASTGAGQRVGELTQDPLLGMAAGFGASGAIDTLGSGRVAGTMVPALRQEIAGRQILKGSENPQAMLDWANASNVPNGASTPVVPGSKPTLGQLTGDVGVLQQERRARNEDSSAFNEREAEQNSARRAQLERQAPANADVMRAPSLFRDQRETIDRATQFALDALTQRAQSEAETLGPGMTPEKRGRDIRTAVGAVKQAAKEVKGRLYDAVDPENKLNIVAAPVREAAQKIAKEVDSLDAQPEAKERQVFQAAAGIPDVLPFQRLRALDRNVTGAMVQERRDNGESPAWRRLVQLKSAVQSAIDRGVENQVAYESAAVARGEIRPQDTIEYRLGLARNDIGENLAPDPAADAERVFNSARANTGPGASGGKGDQAGIYGATGPSIGSSRLLASDQALSGKAGEKFLTETPPKSLPRTRLMEYLAARGGLRLTPDLQQMFGKDVNPVLQTSKGARRLFTINGMSLNDAYQAAKEGGYDLDAADNAARASEVNGDRRIMDLLDRDNSGKEVRPIGDVSEEEFNFLHKMRDAEMRVRSELKANGIDPAKEDKDILRRTIDLVADPASRMDPMDAHERATMENPRTRSGGEAPSGPPRVGETAQKGEVEQPPKFEEPPEEREELTPNFDAGAANRLKAANAANRDYSRTFKEGPVAPALATNGFADNFKLLNSEVPSEAIVKGDAGYEAAKAYLKASKNSPASVAGMADHILDPLRDGLMPIGVVSPSKFAAWRRDYEPALRALDEVLPGFSSRFQNAAGATEAMMKAGVERDAQLGAFQKSEAGKFIGDLGKNDPVEVENAVGRILSDQAAGPTRMEALVKAAASDPDAIDGLKKAGVDWMLRKFSTTAEGATSGEALLSAAQFQKFIADNRATIGKLYGSEGLGNMAAVAHDLARANRSVSATRVKGSPGTAYDIKPMLEKVGHAVGHTGTILGALAFGHEFLGLHGMLGVGAGAVGGAGAYFLNTLRQAGLSKTNALIRDALLNPERARLYLSKLPANADSGKYLGLARMIRRELIEAPVLTPKKSKGQR